MSAVTLEGRLSAGACRFRANPTSGVLEVIYFFMCTAFFKWRLPIATHEPAYISMVPAHFYTLLSVTIYLHLEAHSNMHDLCTFWMELYKCIRLFFQLFQPNQPELYSPKSQSFSVSSLPMSRFSGLISLCMISWSWHHFIARTSWNTYSRVFSGVTPSGWSSRTSSMFYSGEKPWGIQVVESSTHCWVRARKESKRCSINYKTYKAPTLGRSGERPGLDGESVQNFLLSLYSNLGRNAK